MAKIGENLRQRIAAERARMGLRPWQFSPSQIDDRGNPYPPGLVGFAAWEKAKAQRAEIRKTQPRYFDGE